MSQPQLAFISLSDYPNPAGHLQLLYHLENYRNGGIKYTFTFFPNMKNGKLNENKIMEIKSKKKIPVSRNNVADTKRLARWQN